MPLPRTKLLLVVKKGENREEKMRDKQAKNANIPSECQSVPRYNLEDWNWEAGADKVFNESPMLRALWELDSKASGQAHYGQLGASGILKHELWHWIPNGPPLP